MEVIPVSSNNNDINFKNKNAWLQEDFSFDDFSVSALSSILESELRAAKTTHLSCGEVLLPCDLLQSIAANVISLADSEPCGLRGCTLYLIFESDQDCRKLCTIKLDDSTASTFELYLTFKQSNTGWNSYLPKFVKKMTRASTIVISNDYNLEKKKLYRSSE